MSLFCKKYYDETIKKYEVNSNMVSVKMLRVKQLEYQDTNFNDKLILTLNKTRTDAIIETEFVKAVFAANWRRYQRLIIRT